MSHIFISYSKKQRQYAREYADYLIQHGFDVWIDDRIDYGDDWWRAIVNAIRECAAFTVIMTPEADESRWVQAEITLALELEKPLFPLLLAGEKWPLIGRTQYVDVRDEHLPPPDFIERLSNVISPRDEPGQIVAPPPQEQRHFRLSRIATFILVFGVLGMLLISEIIRSSPGKTTLTPSTSTSGRTITINTTPRNPSTGPTAPPRLKSDKYLRDTSLVGNDTVCQPPCFHGITVGQSTFTDALGKVQADSAFMNVQAQNIPVQAASWVAAGGDGCCQMTADKKTGLINTLLVKITPDITAKQIINKYGIPAYVVPLDYTDQEVSLGLIFPKIGLVTWVAVGDPNDTLDETDPIVVVLYFDPKDFPQMVDTSTLLAWNGYSSYRSYKAATPIVTPKITITPQ